MGHSSLIGFHKKISQVTDLELDTYFEIFRRYYDCVSFELFKKDFLAKDYVILLREATNHQVRGFSTVQVYERMIWNKNIRIIFSGDTIIERDFWGQQELPRAWCRLVGEIKRIFTKQDLYWILISKGYRTYLYLPIFFHKYYPRFGRQTPAFEKAIMDDFGKFKYLGDYIPEQGIISFDRSHGQLHPDFAEVPSRYQDHPDVQFFLKQNQNYRKGDELVCLAKIDEENLKSLAHENFLMELSKKERKIEYANSH